MERQGDNKRFGPFWPTFGTDATREGHRRSIMQRPMECLSQEARQGTGHSTRAAITKPTSPSTVGRFIRSTDWGKVFYKVQVHPTMTDKNLADRLAFCSLLTQLGYCEDWPQGRELVEHVLFTDESIVELFPRPNMQNTRIRTSLPNPRNPQQISKNGLKIMVAGGMPARGLTKLHVVDSAATVDGAYYRSRIVPNYEEAARKQRNPTS